MFELLRRKAQSPVIQATIVIIILVFIFWGSQQSGQDGAKTVLTVNGMRISIMEYQRTHDQMVNRIKEQFGGSIPDGLMDKLVSRESVLERLTQRALIKQEAEVLELKASDAEVQDAILKYDAFKEGGIFNEQSYQKHLSAMRLTPVDFENSIRSDLVTTKMVNAINRFARVAPDLIEERFRHDNEEIRIAYTVFKGESFSTEVQVPEEELKKFFEEKKESYKTEPQVKLKYLLFSENKTASPEAANTEKEIKKQADKAYQDIILAGSLANYASSSGAKILESDFYSKKTAPQGSLSAPAAINAIFALQKGELSSLIEIPGGYVIAYMEDMKEPEIPDFNDVKENVEKDFRVEKEKLVAKEKAGEMLAAVKGGAAFKAAADTFKVSVEMSEFFSRSQRHSKGVPNEVVEKALTLTVNSPLLDEVVTAGGFYYVVRVDERKDPDAERFAKEKDSMEKRLKEENSMALFEAWGKALKAKAKIEQNENIFL